jgi:Cu-Zn family superoxide dismutase
MGINRRIINYKTMKKITLLSVSIALLGIVSCKNTTSKEAKTEHQPMEMSEEVHKITFDMESKSGSEVKGTVEFSQMGEEVMMMAYLSGLTPGEHAIHLHEKADCSSEDGKSTGGHWNPTHEPHGAWGSVEGYHKGDIGNFTVGADGKATVHFMTDEWCMDCEDETKNIIGKAVIVHQGTDDLVSQPSGAAGARVSCTGIIQ